MALEKNLWQWLEKVNHWFGEDLHMRRIENLVGEGDADVEGCLKGGAFNIELKSSARPARKTTRVLGPGDLRPGQVPFARQRWKAGGQSYFLIAVGSSHQAKRYLVPGSEARLIVGATEDDLARMSLLSPDCTANEVIERAATFRSPVDPAEL